MFWHDVANESTSFRLDIFIFRSFHVPFCWFLVTLAGASTAQHYIQNIQVTPIPLRLVDVSKRVFLKYLNVFIKMRRFGLALFCFDCRILVQDSAPSET